MRLFVKRPFFDMRSFAYPIDDLALVYWKFLKIVCLFLILNDFRLKSVCACCYCRLVLLNNVHVGYVHINALCCYKAVESMNIYTFTSDRSGFLLFCYANKMARFVFLRFALLFRFASNRQYTHNQCSNTYSHVSLFCFFSWNVSHEATNTFICVVSV